MEKAVECQLCGSLLLHITWTHLIWNHGITVEEYRRRFPSVPLQSEDFVSSRIDSLTGRPQSFEERYSKSRSGQSYWDSKEGQADSRRNHASLSKV